MVREASHDGFSRPVRSLQRHRPHSLALGWHVGRGCILMVALSACLSSSPSWSLMVAPTTTNQAFSPALSGPYLTASAAYAAGFRKWPLVIMTAIAGREAGWNNDAPHTDNNGVSSTGLWQINSTNTTGLTDPMGNANRAFAMAGGNSLGGLGAWALTPPGSTSVAG